MILLLLFLNFQARLDPVKAVCLDPWCSLILENLVVIIVKFKKEKKKGFKGGLFNSCS